MVVRVRCLGFKSLLGQFDTPQLQGLAGPPAAVSLAVYLKYSRRNMISMEISMSMDHAWRKGT